MRKLLTWVIVTIGIAALVRKLRSRGQASTAENAVADVDGVTSEPPPVADDPADELRQRLASSREPDAPDSPAAAEPATPEPTSEPSIDERRTEVHDEGRAAIDEMRKSAED